MDQQRLKDALAFGREQAGVEFKGAGSRKNTQLHGKVLRAILAMANRANGGAVIIGVRDDGTDLHLDGLSNPDLATWGFDDLASSAATYADPYLDFDVHVIELNGKRVVWVQVEEFSLTPVICKKALQDGPKAVLRKGALYVRGLGRVESVEVPSHVEMRDLVDRAAERRARQLLQQVHRLGLSPEAFEGVSPRDQYEAQVSGSDFAALSTEVRSKGAWERWVYPPSFDAARCGRLSEVGSRVAQASVDLVGWDFPHVNRHDGPMRGMDWTGQSTHWGEHVEAWIAFKSGLFVCATGIRTDWMDQKPRQRRYRHDGPALPLEETVLQFVELYEFATRYSELLELGEVVIEVGLSGLANRDLVMSPMRPGFFEPKVARLDEWSFKRQFSRALLAADARRLALEPAAELFELFNWDTTEDNLREILDSILRQVGR